MATQTLQEGINTLAGLLSNGDSLRIVRGGQTVVTSVDQSALTSLVNVEISATAAVSLGGNGSNFKSLLSGTFSHAGSGRVYGEAYQGGAVSTWARSKIIGPGFFLGRNGTFTRYEQSDGTGDFDGNCIIPTCAVTGGTFTAAFITGVSGYQSAYFTGGTVFTERGLDTNFTGARMTVTGGCECHVARSNLTSTITQSPGTTNMPMGTDGNSTGVIEVTGANTYLDWQGFTIDTLIVLGGARIDMTSAPVSFSITTLITDRQSLEASLWQSKIPGVAITYPSIGANRIIFGANSDTIPG